MVTPANAAPVSPHLSLWDTVSVIVGIIIGVGIYKVPAEVLGYTWDPWLALVLWILGGLLCLIGALCYAELAATYPRSGGDYEYLSRAYGRPIGFLFAFGQITVIRTAGSIAAVAYLLTPFAARLLGLDGEDSLTCIVLATVPIVVLSAANGLGVFLGKATQNALTGLKILGIGGIVLVGIGWGSLPNLVRGKEEVRRGVCLGIEPTTAYYDSCEFIQISELREHNRWGIWTHSAVTLQGYPVVDTAIINVDGQTHTSRGDPHSVHAVKPGMNVEVTVEPTTVKGEWKVVHIRATSRSPLEGLVLALIAILWTYAGWHEAAYVTAEVRNQQRTLPRALLLGTLLVMGIYLAVHLACLAALGFDLLADSAASSATPVADVLALALGEYGARAMCGLVVLSCLSSINGMIFTSARLYSVLGQDHALFRPLGRWSQRWGTPLRSIVVQAALGVAVIALVGWFFSGQQGFNKLLEFTAAVFWLFFGLTGVGLLILRWRDPDRQRPFRVPLFPFLPLIFIACCLGMIVASVLAKPLESAVGLGVLLLGIPLYWLSERRGQHNIP